MLFLAHLVSQMTCFLIKPWIFRIFDCCQSHKNSCLTGASTALQNGRERTRSFNSGDGNGFCVLAIRLFYQAELDMRSTTETKAS